MLGGVDQRVPRTNLIVVLLRTNDDSTFHRGGFRFIVLFKTY